MPAKTMASSKASRSLPKSPGASRSSTTRSARRPGAIAPGLRADIVVLDSEAPGLFGREREALLDAMVFAGTQNTVRDVFVGGRQVVEEGHHIAEHAVLARVRGAMSSLLA